MTEKTFFVPGIPVAKGSAKAFYNKAAGRVVVMQTNRDRQRPWASAISVLAIDAGVRCVSDAPVFIGMLFQFPRPQSHFRGKAKTLREDSPLYHINTPDADKLARCVLDALTSVAWHDDKQAQITDCRKVYSDQSGVWITINHCA